MSLYHPYSVFPLGDAALIIDFGNKIDEGINSKVLGLFHQLQENRHPYITGLVPAYSSLTVYYDVCAVWQKKEQDKTAFETMAELIENLCAKGSPIQQQNRLIEVPVCYGPKFATDMHCIVRQNKIAIEEIIQLHTAQTYKVYMVGFLPGFAYMGQVDERIAITRKPQPTAVLPGAVGIAGRQTGIYPLASPGGWQIIGRTPLQLFDKDRKQPVLFRPGDEVKFYSITEDEFAHY